MRELKTERSPEDIAKLHDLYGALNKALDRERDSHREEIDAILKRIRTENERMKIVRELSELQIKLGL